MPEFGITISPPYYPYDSVRLHHVFTYDIQKILNKISNYYCLYPEFDKNGRLHYHGVINIKDKLGYYKKKYLIDRIGYCKIDPLKSFKDKLRWLVYCTKEYALLAEEYAPIIYKSFKKIKQFKLKEKKPKNILSYFV